MRPWLTTALAVIAVADDPAIAFCAAPRREGNLRAAISARARCRSSDAIQWTEAWTARGNLHFKQCSSTLEL